MKDMVEIAIGLVMNHPAVQGVEFAGSRSRGTHEELSNWDFAAQTSDFTAVARDLPNLVAPLEPLGQQWEPMGHFPVYFVVAEALTNVAKHARAGHAEVTARVDDGMLAVQVRDDGIGGARPGGSGLTGPADRRAALDGELRVESPSDGGTLLATAIPLRR